MAAKKSALTLVDERFERTFELSLAEPNAERVITRADGTTETLPPGVCGRLTGIALVYNEVDDYGTMFAPGCLDKTRIERVQAGRVKLFADHGPFTHTHVGTVRSLTDVSDGVVMSADLFDTDAGRRMKEYLAAVLASQSDTGLSIGFRRVQSEWKQIDPSKPEGPLNDSVLVFQEISLREVSITPVPAVPGAEVTGVRREPGESDPALLRRMLGRILREIPEAEARAAVDAAYASGAAEPDTQAASTPQQIVASPEGTADAAGADGSSGTPSTAPVPAPEPVYATMDERAALLRSSYR